MSDLVVRGGTVLVDGAFVDADVRCRDGAIAEIGPPGSLAGAAIVSAARRLVAPGFVDAQINGGWGHDFTSDPAAIAAVAAALPATGVTAFLPTIVTAPAGIRTAALAALADSPGAAAGSAIALGLHFEGPAIAAERAGAHDSTLVAALDPAEVAAWPPHVRMVTVAPEREGALEAIAALARAGVTVAIGHTSCSPAEFAAARSAGATAVTHLFNAMAPFGHRTPGPIGATLADPDVIAGLICDGVHVDPVAVAIAWKVLGPERTMLVTDAAAALGLPIGADVRLGGVTVTVGADGVRTAAGVLAGSNLTMDQAVRNLVAFTRCTPAEALSCASAVPARLLGLGDRGTIAVGARADLVLLDHDLHVRATFVAGELAWEA